MAREWSNWSGSVRWRPDRVLAPGSIDEIAEVVSECRREGRKLRVVGSVHSFTPLVATDDTLLSLDGFQGIESVDVERRTALIRAGTKLDALGPELLRHGLAQENLGDIDVQSLAGAISTGTHGTGAELGNIATQVQGLTLVTGTGEVMECSAEKHPGLFKAAQVSLGALGVVAKVRLRLLPAYRLGFRSERRRLDDVLADLPERLSANRHFEFFWFPYGPFVQAKTANPSDLPAGSGLALRAQQVILENGALWLASQASRLIPRLAPSISRLSGRLVGHSGGVAEAHGFFATRRAVRFNEMEYNVPAERFLDAFAELRALFDRHRFRVNFPVECRFAAGDEIWLSPAYERASAYIAVHMYRGMPYEEYFRACEEVFDRYEGRPHWGKLHWQSSDSLRLRYPRWDDFLRVREEVDPDRVFLNDYLSELFGLRG
ncbi:MAG: D-arabinono-1,4-lactone oxidase [Actinomycetota bacterium]